MENSYQINGMPVFAEPQNAPLVDFKPGSPEWYQLQTAIKRIRSQEKPPLLPLWVGGMRMSYVLNGPPGICIPPHDPSRTLATYVRASGTDVHASIRATMDAASEWRQIPWFMRLHLFQRAAYLLEKKYFFEAVAAVMEDYSKNPFEAMIDVVELIDFLNFNVWFAYQIYQEQPASADFEFNYVDYRPWNGYIAVLPPNNFIAIAVNLCTAPLTMGNVVICKPAPETIYSFHFMLNILHEAGLPKNVLSVLHGDEEMIGRILLTDPDLAHVHFTGSMQTMHKLIRTVGENIENYRGFPRVIGETGGKDFIVVYDDIDPREVAAAIARSGFGYQGRKCSAASRAYMTHAMWKKVKPILESLMSEMRVGDVADPQNYMGAIISEQEYKKIVGYIERARNDQTTKEIIGGNYNDNNGWWIHPTVIVTLNPHAESMEQEIFGPVVTVYTASTMENLEKYALSTSPYRLTGSVQTNDIAELSRALNTFRFTAGNIYDFGTTGAIVNRQPFGGSGKSGTNSKPGFKMHMYNWTDPQTVGLKKIKPTHFAPSYLTRD